MCWGRKERSSDVLGAKGMRSPDGFLSSPQSAWHFPDTGILLLAHTQLAWLLRNEFLFPQPAAESPSPTHF